MQKNIPYVKVYDENGVLTNPIKKSYFSPYQNRRQRRQRLGRPIGNHKGVSIITTNDGKYQSIFFKVLQKIKIEGKRKMKTILHYVPRSTDK